MRGGFSALPAALEARRAAGLYRSRTVLDSAQGPRVRIDGKDLLAFCSNDYLGLANDPRVVAAFRDGEAWLLREADKDRPDDTMLPGGTNDAHFDAWHGW